LSATLVIDIETRADSRLLGDSDYLEEVSKDWKNNAIKDEFKLQAWKDEKLATHIRTMALRPTTGKVVAIGMASLGSGRNKKRDPRTLVLCDMDSEPMVLADMIYHLDNIFPGKRIVCGVNVRKFDIPFLTARCAINDIELPDWWPFIRDWHNVADTMDILGDQGKLSDWCRAFGIEQPDVTGQEVTSLSREDLIEHCRQDMVATTTILSKIKRRFPCLRKTKMSPIRL
jgi:hypothetical protein